jgi:16S rRNA (guanine966-N2)-methyltransferase
MPARRKNTVRVIGGLWKRRLLEFPDVPDLRPTPDRVRETLFNWLGQDLTGMVCLDLFAGSGALGFEAASRGAKQVVLVEKDPEALQALRASKALLAAAQVEIVRGEALAVLAADDRRFDVAFLDPPFRSNLLPKVLPALAGRLADGAKVYVESGGEADLPPGYTVLRELRAGQVRSLLLEWKPIQAMSSP